MAEDRPYLELPPDVRLIGVLTEEQLIIESLRQKFDAEGVEQTMGSIILAQPLDSGATGSAEIITFPLIADEAQFDNEIRLDRTDSFTIFQWGLFLGFRTTASLPAAKAGVDMMLAGPNPASITAGLTDAMFWAFQRSKLILKTDTVTYVDTVDNVRSRRVGVAQQGLDPGAAVLYSADAWGKDHGMTPMRPTITLSGAFKNKVQIQLPRPTSTAGLVDTNTTHVTLLFRGILNQGGAEFRTAKL